MRRAGARGVQGAEGTWFVGYGWNEAGYDATPAMELGPGRELQVTFVASGLATAAIDHWLVPWPFHASPWAVGLAVVFSTGVGLVFGTYPAWRGSRLDPVEALRSE